MSFKQKLLIFWMIFFMDFSLASEPPAVGKLAFPQGEVQVNGTKIAKTQDLKEGDEVETFEGSCTLLLGKESVVHLGRQSKMKITRYLLGEQGKEEEATLDLAHGQSRALIRRVGKTRKRYQIRTASAVMGVRGTHLMIDAPQGGDARFVTIEGSAELRPNQGPQQILSAGEMLSISPAATGDGQGVPSVSKVQMDRAEIKQMAEKIAPPPQNITTPQQMEPGSGPGPAGPKGPGLPFNGPGLPPLPPLDPVANSLVPASVSISLSKVNP